MGFIILRMGVELAWGALEELIDTGLDEALVVAVQETLQATAGVRGLRELGTPRICLLYTSDAADE